MSRTKTKSEQWFQNHFRFLVSPSLLTVDYRPIVEIHFDGVSTSVTNPYIHICMDFDCSISIVSYQRLIKLNLCSHADPAIIICPYGAVKIKGHRKMRAWIAWDKLSQYMTTDFLMKAFYSNSYIYRNGYSYKLFTLQKLFILIRDSLQQLKDNIQYPTLVHR
jgi:hypothetical protein